MSMTLTAVCVLQSRGRTSHQLSSLNSGRSPPAGGPRRVLEVDPQTRSAACGGRAPPVCLRRTRASSSGWIWTSHSAGPSQTSRVLAESQRRGWGFPRRALGTATGTPPGPRRSAAERLATTNLTQHGKKTRHPATDDTRAAGKRLHSCFHFSSRAFTCGVRKIR